jgi:hypothetical protein
VFIWNALTGATEKILKKAHSYVSLSLARSLINWLIDVVVIVVVFRTTVGCVGWSANGHQIVSCDRAANIVLWDSS